MSATAFLQLRNALRDHLLIAPAAAGGRVYAGRVRPIAQGEASAVNVRLSDATPGEGPLEFSDWQTVLYLDCCARGTPAGDDADTAADALLDDVYTRLYDFVGSLPAQNVGVLDIAVDATVEWDAVAEDVPYTCASLRLTVQHRTPATSLQPQA